MILAAAVPGPAGFAILSQEIEADDYHDRAVTFRGHLRATDVANQQPTDSGDAAKTKLEPRHVSKVSGRGPPSRTPASR